MDQSGRVRAGWAVYRVPSFCTVRVAGLANTLSSCPPISGTCQQAPLLSNASVPNCAALSGQLPSVVKA